MQFFAKKKDVTNTTIYNKISELSIVISTMRSGMEQLQRTITTISNNNNNDSRKRTDTNSYSTASTNVPIVKNTTIKFIYLVYMSVYGAPSGSYANGVIVSGPTAPWDPVKLTNANIIANAYVTDYGSGSNIPDPVCLDAVTTKVINQLLPLFATT